MTIIPENSAMVIMIGGRYFYGFDRAGRVRTAWFLAGAKLYGLGLGPADPVIERLNKKGVRFMIVRVYLAMPVRR